MSAKGCVRPISPGERSPIWDPYARGVLFGLSVTHTRADIIRAILEGVAFTFAHNLEISVTAVRLAFILLTLIHGVGVILYAALWVLLPDRAGVLDQV